MDLSYINEYIDHLLILVNKLENDEKIMISKKLTESKINEDKERVYEYLYALHKHLHYVRNIDIGDYGAWLHFIRQPYKDIKNF